jgi:hypothetical protein
MTQFAFMRSPGTEHDYEVGDTVEVFCDHEKSSERIRGWLKGIVVQVDSKMVAVQFRMAGWCRTAFSGTRSLPNTSALWVPRRN